MKRSGDREPFDAAKIIAGLEMATKGRPVESAHLATMAGAVEEELRLDGAEVGTDQVGRAVLEQLRDVDVVAAIRFASVYKEFSDLADFERELDELMGRAQLTKATSPKPHPAGEPTT